MTLFRPASRWYALCLAAAVTLALNPRACGDPGWQLSFAAVAGILILGPPMRRAPGWLAEAGRSSRRPGWAQGLVDGLAEGGALTISATVATAPLLAHHFDAVSLAALPANLLALPAVAPAMWPACRRPPWAEGAHPPPPARPRGAGTARRAPAELSLERHARFGRRARSRLMLPFPGPSAVVAPTAGWRHSGAGRPGRAGSARKPRRLRLAGGLCRAFSAAGRRHACSRWPAWRVWPCCADRARPASSPCDSSTSARATRP